MDLIYDQVFTREKDDESIQITLAEYDRCRFEGVDLVGQDFGRFRFIECEFVDCDLSQVDLSDTVLQNIRMVDCRARGVVFERCDTLGLQIFFERCQLDFASFYGMNLKRFSFVDCGLTEVDFTEADMNGVNMTGSDLDRAQFERTNLSEVDLRGAVQYTIDPELNQLKGAKFSAPEVLRLLAKYQIKIEPIV